MISVLSMDEQIEIFLNQWEAKRAGLLTKYQLQAEHFRNKPGMPICYESACRKVDHYRHEINMLRELRARSV